MVDSSTKASHTPQQAIVDCPNTPRATSQPTPLQDFRHGEGVGVIVDHDFCCGLVAADAHHLPWPTLSITALLIWPHSLPLAPPLCGHRALFGSGRGGAHGWVRRLVSRHLKCSLHPPTPPQEQRMLSRSFLGTPW